MFRLFTHLSLWSCAIFLGGCALPNEIIMANQYLRDAVNVAPTNIRQAEPFDLSRLAFIQEVELNSRYYPDRDPKDVVCDSYCMRLLYSGQLKSVIVANLLIERPDEEVTNNDSIDSEATEVCNLAMPKEVGVKCRFTGIKEFRIESRPACPPPQVRDEQVFYLQGNGSSETETDRDSFRARSLAAVGQCLIESDVNLRQASLIIFRDLQKNGVGNRIQGFNKHASYDVAHRAGWSEKSILAYRFANGGPPELAYRYSQVSVWVKQTFSIPTTSCCSVYRSTDKRSLHEILTADFKLSFPLLPMPTHTGVKQALASIVLDPAPPPSEAFTMVKEFYAEIEAKGTLDQLDLKILESIIAREDGAIPVLGMASALREVESTKVPLIPILINRASSAMGEMDGKAFPSGDRQDFGFILSRMPLESRLPYKAQILELIQNSPTYYPVGGAGELFKGLSYNQVEPLLKKYFKEPNNDFGREALFYLCSRGETLPQFTPDLIDYYKQLGDSEAYNRDLYFSTVLNMKMEAEIFPNLTLGKVQREAISTAKYRQPSARCRR
jgi:hypothetical protein